MRSCTAARGSIVNWIDWLAIAGVVPTRGVSRLARFNVTADALADKTTGKVKYFEGTPIPTSIVIVALLGVACYLGRIEESLWLGADRVGPALLHPLSLVYVASGSAMISGTMHVPKP